MNEVSYEKGMTKIWSDGEKIRVENDAGIKWVQQNVDDLLGKGEWYKIQKVMYMETDHARDRKYKHNGYECLSGYIPAKVIADLAEELPKDVEKDSKLDALREL
jgi:hypothetical protein